MILENGLGRVFLGVHWSFDAFGYNYTTDKPVITPKLGGVPLGLSIANDIFDGGLKPSP